MATYLLRRGSRKLDLSVFPLARRDDASAHTKRKERPATKQRPNTKTEAPANEHASKRATTERTQHEAQQHKELRKKGGDTEV